MAAFFPRSKSFYSPHSLQAPRCIRPMALTLRMDMLARRAVLGCCGRAIGSTTLLCAEGEHSQRADGGSLCYGHNGDPDRKRAISTPVEECSAFFGALTLLTCGLDDACKAGIPVPDEGRTIVQR